MIARKAVRARTITRLLIGVAGATAIATGAATLVSASPAAAGMYGAARPVRYSHLPWPSGVFVGGGDRATHEQFARWRGRSLDTIVTFTSRSTWNDIINPTYFLDRWKGTRYTKVFSLPPFPESGASMNSCAAGRYNAKWKQFARTVRHYGMDDEIIVRLGWEMNGDWFAWNARNPKKFVACWRNVVRSAESVAPKLRWDWTVNRGPGKALTDARRAYPGDRYVDFIGVDSYDAWPAVTNASSWNQHYASKYGLKFWLDFAKAHHKRFTVPEWGIHHGPSTLGVSGRDNPYYVTKMTSFFRRNAFHIGYEAYFNERDPYIANSLYGPAQNPRAATAYRAAMR